MTLGRQLAQTDSKEKGAAVRFPPPLVFLGGVILGIVIDRFVVACSFPVAPSMGLAIGTLLMAIGVALPVWARTHFVRTGQRLEPWEPTPELIFGGPYRFTRNPIYIGMTLIEIGLGVALNNVWISALALPALAAVHLIAVVPEERYLSGKFGDSYRDYLGRVRRYL